MKKVKTTMLDYLDWRGDLTFVLDKPNEVDFLIFSTLSYVDFSTAPFVNSLNVKQAPTLKNVYNALLTSEQGDAEFMRLFEKCANSERYKDIVVFGYESIIEEEKELQFAAVSFLLPEGEVVISFRGTDDSIVGWKEDLNMSFEEVPSQLLAKLYTEKIADACADSPIYLTGHSKGGNLAVWAGANVEDKYFDSIAYIYDNDGPGFCGDFTKSEGFKRIRDKAVKYVVDMSVIGMLLDNETKRRIVASNEASTLMQHYPMSWLVVGNRFLCLDERSPIARTTEAVICEWVDTLTQDERKRITNIIADVVESSNAKTVSDLRGRDTLPNIIAMLKAYADKDKEDRQFLLETAGRLTAIIKNYAKSNISGIGNKKHIRKI